MAEFLLELFSEEIPANLQSTARINLLTNFKKFFEKENINYKDHAKVFSTPNRLVLCFKKVEREINQKSEEIRGPNTKAPDNAVEGFLKSNLIQKQDIYKKNTDKGEFFFYKKPSRKIKSEDVLKASIPSILENLPWKKSMKWGEHNLYWGRPLKSILAIFDNKPLKFEFHHLSSSNSTYIDKDFEEKTKIFKNINSYFSYFKKLNVIIDNELRKKYIKKKLIYLSNKKNLQININEKLLNEVTDIVEKPKVISCTFDKKYLNIPKEIITITMRHHQRYFPTFDKKDSLTNNFFIIADSLDPKSFVKIGNERVINARLSDAEFFWNKNKSQNLVKQISKLKNINFFKGLGNYYDKVQRIRKLSSLISDELLISKEKIEIASSICKVDLLSDLVGEFPELQGVLGGYFAEAQGFEKEVCIAVSEHYLPTGLESRIPKKPYSIALSLSDKLDSLVGFFGLNLKPSSSKDPYALRRSAIGLLKMILENNKELKLRDLINYSCQLYSEQNISFNSKNVQKDLSEFFHDRFKNFMKEKEIRNDIIESVTLNYNIDNILKIYKKTLILNKLISKEIGKDVMFSYKRASNIISNELKNNKIELADSADPGLFKNEFEKILYKKIDEIRKDYTNIGRDGDYEGILKTLSLARKEVDEFFDNVIVNDQDELIKKNRLELLQMLCKTFDNYLNFSKVESF
jgi:glycyl-tRNA synthetase beta chain